MTFNRETWQAAAQQKMQEIGRWLDRRRQGGLPYVAYSTVAGLTLWPLVEAAAETGHFWPIVGVMYDVSGSGGGDVIAAQLQRWQDQAQPPGEEEVAGWVAEQVADSHELREALNTILAALAVLPAAQNALDEADRAQFRQTLREELAQLGTPDHLQLALAGSGAAAQGPDAQAVGERGVLAEGDVGGSIIVGDNASVQTIIHQYGEGREQAPDVEALQAQIGRYLTWLQDWAGTLELRGIQRQGEQVVQLPLEEVYVPLAATIYGSRSNVIDLNEILRQGRRLILTGGPGSGKTTVLLHIAWALSQAIADDDLALAENLVGFTPATWKTEDENEPDEIETLPLPIFVPLSAYALHRRDLSPQDDRTLATFITQYLFDRQTSFDLPNDFFRHLLRQGRSVLLLLDGLDEVPDEAERVQVRQAIEDLVTGRDRMRVVVTCRSAAYQGRTALGKGFREVTTQPLKETHVTALVKHAYAHLYRTDMLLQQQKTDELLQGIAQLETERRVRLGDDAPRLIDSPLLVRMLLVVHYRERRLPEQRAELYMKATDAMLLPDYAPDVETANLIGQLVGGSWEVHRDLVQHLAFHMHRRGEKQGREIEEVDLRQLLAAEPAYAPLVDDFIALTRLRGTLLEERSGQYRFLHLAFQEFLAARYLAEIVRSEGGIKAIVTFLEEGPLFEIWWREVILLVAGYFAVTSPQTAQSFLERLAGVDKTAINRSTLPAPMQLTAVELAVIAWLEWPGKRTLLRQQLVERFDALFTDAPLMAQVDIALRIRTSHALDRLGDTRPGVGFVVRDGVKLPDIAWGKEVPAGRYTIGGDENAWNSFQKKQVPIYVPYRLARYPITNAQFQCFINAPDRDAPEWWQDIPNREKQISEPKSHYGNHPRERVSWYQAVAFTRWLTAKLRAGTLPAAQLEGDLAEYVIRLPHEYEWEVAARWPNTDIEARVYPWGAEFDAAKVNTREGNSAGQTTSVGIYPGGQNTALELYDLSGNVWEWCRNEYATPEYTAMSRARRSLRGGSWYNFSILARVASRLSGSPSERDVLLGFRVVVVRRSLISARP